MFDTSTYTHPHYGVVIIGAGISGLATAIQLKKKYNYGDLLIIEKNEDVGGTWLVNSYPGAGCDIPIGLYQYSFAPSANFSSQWASQSEIHSYISKVREQYAINSILFRTSVVGATWSPITSHWVLEIYNHLTHTTTFKSCNILISATGALREPNIPDYALDAKFNGEVFHSSRWDHEVDLRGKDVVVVGNGCSAAQIIPEIVGQVKSLTQVARSRQTIFPKPPVPDGDWWWWFMRWVPGMLFLQRVYIFYCAEKKFQNSDIEKGSESRAKEVELINRYMKAHANPKYWNDLLPDFDVAAKRRICDAGYLDSTNHPNFSLLQGSPVVRIEGSSVFTADGKEVHADVVILCTGFKVHDLFAPLEVFNGEGESLMQRMRETGQKAYRGTFFSGYPNFATIRGPNTGTAHSSVIFVVECQIRLILSAFGPAIKALSKHSFLMGRFGPAVAVTKEAETEYFDKLRAEMKKKVWEQNGGVSWYVDKKTHWCSALYPWSQVELYWQSLWAQREHFVRVGC